MANDDIAAVAASVLRNPRQHMGKTYRMGYDVKTCDEIAAIPTRIVGQPFRYEARPPAEFREKTLVAAGDLAYFECAYRNMSLTRKARAQVPRTGWTTSVP